MIGGDTDVVQKIACPIVKIEAGVEQNVASCQIRDGIFVAKKTCRKCIGHFRNGFADDCDHASFGISRCRGARGPSLDEHPLQPNAGKYPLE